MTAFKHSIKTAAFVTLAAIIMAMTACGGKPEPIETDTAPGSQLQQRIENLESAAEKNIERAAASEKKMFSAVFAAFVVNLLISLFLFSRIKAGGGKDDIKNPPAKKPAKKPARPKTAKPARQITDDNPEI